jgi:L-lactate dehydrogenase complex protein LldG
MMATREQFIGAVGKALGRSELPATPARFIYRHTVHTDVMRDWNQGDLARIFVEYSKIIDASVFETTKAALNSVIRQAVERCGPGKIIVAKDSLLEEMNTVHDLAKSRTVRVWNTEGSWEENVHFSEEAAVGIAVAKMALAESGTVLLFSHNGCGRSVTLLPESAIYIIPQSSIRPRLTQGMAFVREYKDHLPSSINFVSGPSATSDIELVRVVGVHGPVHVAHIVVNDI